MKKLIILSLIFILSGCSMIDNEELKADDLEKKYQGSLSVDNIILDFEGFNSVGGGERIRNIIYENFDNLVIEMGSANFIDGIEKYTGDELLIHIGYDVWKTNSIEILNKLKELNLSLININIRQNYGKENENIKSIILSEEEAKIFFEFKTKNKNLMLTMGKYGIGEIICSDKVVEILGVKKEECGIIQIR